VASRSFAVLYFPAGTYRITRTLATTRTQHAEYLGVSVIGEDPATTTLSWDGPAGQNILVLDAWYAKVSRLTFDGRTRAAVGLHRGDSFSTACELSDLVFRDMQVGIQMGRSDGAGQAEHMILRCRFQRCARAGILTSNWNSLDVWVWYCRFEDCAYGVYNERGNFHVFKSVFLRSTQGDVGADNLQMFALVSNTSVGSRTFTDWGGDSHPWGALLLLQGNRIYDTTGDRAIVTGSAGPWVLLDNVVRNRAGYDGPAVRLAANDQVLIGNTFTTSTPVEVAPDAGRGALRVRALDQRVVAREDVPEPSAELPPIPPNLHRKVFEVTGRTEAAIQAQIDAASAEPAGTRPVVHLARGTYRIGATVTVPAGEDLQLVGDGPGPNATNLSWSGSSGGPVLLLAGPSRAVLRDLAVAAVSPGVGGIVVTNADQPGGRIYANQLIAGGDTPSPDAATSGVHVDGLESTDVALAGYGFAFAERGVVVRGGPARASGLPAAGQVTGLGGASNDSGLLYDVVDGGELVAGPAWYEAHRWTDPKKFDLRSSGSLTVFGLQLAVTKDPATPMVQLHGHRGTFTMLASLLSGGDGSGVAHQFLLDGSGDGMRVLSMGNMVWADGPVPGGEQYVWLDRTSRAQAALLESALNGAPNGRRFAALENVANRVKGAEAGDAFLREALALLRNARVEPPDARPPGVTGLELFRVYSTVRRAPAVELRR
jgi:hypothetical protein